MSSNHTRRLCIAHQTHNTSYTMHRRTYSTCQSYMGSKELLLQAGGDCYSTSFLGLKPATRQTPVPRGKPHRERHCSPGNPRQRLTSKIVSIRGRYAAGRCQESLRNAVRLLSVEIAVRFDGKLGWMASTATGCVSLASLVPSRLWTSYLRFLRR